MNAISADGAWHVGSIVGMALAGLIILVALAVAVWGAIDRDPILALGAVGSALVVAGFWVLLNFPPTAEFHKYYRVEGQVEQISDRLVPAGKGMQQRFVLVIDGQPFGVDDTRAALVKPGQSVVLQCSRDYQYAGDSGWVCEWGQQR